jgi:F-type H+-transporting ATPase subunit epsilon
VSDVFWVEVVSADKSVFKRNARSLTVTTKDGVIGILPHHIPLIATLETGFADIETETGDHAVVAITGGFVSVTLTRTAVISPYAKLVKDIDEAAVRAFLKEKDPLAEAGTLPPEDHDNYQRAVAQMAALRRSRGDGL